jgi:hypothetical protein
MQGNRQGPAGGPAGQDSRSQAQQHWPRRAGAALRDDTEEQHRFMTMTSKEISGGVVHELPEDLQKALAADAAALAAWEDLTPLVRNEWICWTISVKSRKPEGSTLKGCALSSKGMRRPCCGWAACTARISLSAREGQFAFDLFSPTASRMSAFNATSSMASPS